MTAEGFLDLFGLREHPDFLTLADDLQEEFAAVGETFLADRAGSDPLLRAMLNPAYATWRIEHVDASVLRPGLWAHHHRDHDHDLRGTITAVDKEWATIEFDDGDRRSFQVADWNAERDWARVPVPLDAATIADTGPIGPLTA